MKIYKVEKFVANLHDYAIRTINLKQALNHGLVLTKVVLTKVIELLHLNKRLGQNHILI